jgi:hypothetical protein
MKRRVLHLQEDEAIAAIERGSTRGIRNALSEEAERFEALAEHFRHAYLMKAWLSPFEVAEYLGWDVEGMRRDSLLKAVRRLHDQGLPYRAIGRQRMTRREDLEEWISTQRNGG